MFYIIHNLFISVLIRNLISMSLIKVVQKAECGNCNNKRKWQRVNMNIKAVRMTG
jgi:hypothetical protein